MRAEPRSRVNHSFLGPRDSSGDHTRDARPQCHCLKHTLEEDLYRGGSLSFFSLSAKGRQPCRLGPPLGLHDASGHYRGLRLSFEQPLASLMVWEMARASTHLSAQASPTPALPGQEAWRCAGSQAHHTAIGSRLPSAKDLGLCRGVLHLTLPVIVPGPCLISLGK